MEILALETKTVFGTRLQTSLFLHLNMEVHGDGLALGARLNCPPEELQLHFSAVEVAAWSVSLT